MDEGFVPLAALVLAERSETRTAVDVVPTTAPPAASEPCAFAHGVAIDDLTALFLHAREALESAAREALALFARDVLARELELAPVAIEALVARLLARAAAVEPIAIDVSSADRERVRAPFPIRVDPALAAGDLVVRVRDGALESRFAFRAATVLARASSAR